MINQQEIAEGVKHILEKGLNINVENNPHLKDTPERVARAYKEVFEGYEESPYKYDTTFPNPNKNRRDIIILGPITCYSICSHHILPFKMEVYVGYIPNTKIIGISKIERITRNICHKLQVQENVGHEIINVLNKILEPYGVIVYITNSIHTCMTMRGVNSKNAGLTTKTVDGIFYEKEYEENFFKMIEQR